MSAPPTNKTYSVLFVCTANQIRSPIAAALFKKILEKDGALDQWRIESAGTWVNNRRAAPRGVQEIMSERGLDISQHHARPVTTELLHGFSLILTMEAGQKEALQIEFRDIADRVFMLGELAGTNQKVSDPARGTTEDFLCTAAEIEGLLVLAKNRIVELAGIGVK